MASDPHDTPGDDGSEDGSSPRPSGEPEDAGPRPGMHPEAKRSGSGRSTAIALAVVLGLAILLYAAITLGVAGSN